MLVFKDHAAARVILIGVACVTTGPMVMSEPKLLSRAMSGSVFLLG